MTAAEHYAARVDAVLAQRARLRGAEPSGDLFGDLEPDHPLLKADPRRPLDANLKALADLIEPSDAIVDVGGGAGRMSLPLALRCRSVTNVDPSASMGAAFLANAKAAGISNVDLVQGDWLAADTPQGTVALVNHVTYLTRDIVPFIEKLERAGSRRVILTVNAPPPPSWNRVLFQLVHGEAEEVVPGHAELMNVLWEMGRLPDLTMLLSAERALHRAAAEPGGRARLRRATRRQRAMGPLAGRRRVRGAHPRHGGAAFRRALRARRRRLHPTLDQHGPRGPHHLAAGQVAIPPSNP